MDFEEYKKDLIKNLEKRKNEDDIFIFLCQTFGSLIISQLMINDLAIKKLKELLE